jgi:hypothetical protein
MGNRLNVKVGDQVIIYGSYRNKSLGTVEKITPTGLIKVNGTLYNQDGYIRGGGAWNTGSISEATPELIKEVNENNTISLALSKMRKCSSLTYEKALKIIEILKEN